jgi:hypothetical protein
MSYERLAEELIDSQRTMLGPKAVDVARSVPGLTVEDDGSVTDVADDDRAAIAALVEEYLTMMGGAAQPRLDVVADTYEGPAVLPENLGGPATVPDDADVSADADEESAVESRDEPLFDVPAESAPATDAASDAADDEATDPSDDEPTAPAGSEAADRDEGVAAADGETVDGEAAVETDDLGAMREELDELNDTELLADEEATAPDSSPADAAGEPTAEPSDATQPVDANDGSEPVDVPEAAGESADEQVDGPREDETGAPSEESDGTAETAADQAATAAASTEEAVGTSGSAAAEPSTEAATEESDPAAADADEAQSAADSEDVVTNLWNTDDGGDGASEDAADRDLGSMYITAEGDDGWSSPVPVEEAVVDAVTGATDLADDDLAAVSTYVSVAEVEPLVEDTDSTPVTFDVEGHPVTVHPDGEVTVE